MESASASAGEGLCKLCGTPLTDRSPAGICPACLFPPTTSDNRLHAPPTVEDLALALPRFLISNRLGEGTMGCVFQAYDQELKRTVAIKAMHAQPDMLKRVERFTLEYQLMAGLGHPNIPTIYDHGSCGDLYYYVLEWMRDRCLANQLNHLGRLRLKNAVNIIRQICQALEHAHSRNIIHRDIKPSNVLISGSCVKVADFGLAKRLDAPPGDRLTIDRAVLGTPGFMAPEQTHGNPNVDERADIYSLGAILYRMLTGRVPEGRIRRPHRFGAPPCFDQVLLKALEQNPESRHTSVEAFGNDVEDAWQCTIKPPRRWWSRWIGMAGPS